MRLTKAITLLAVYLVWIYSSAFIAISCHINRETHIHCCINCECHHEGCDKSHFEKPHACNHDHSNKVVLYDTTKENSLNIEPIALNIAALLSNNIHIEEIATLSVQHYHEHSIPIPPEPLLSRRSMRAPPVFA